MKILLFLLFTIHLFANNGLNYINKLRKQANMNLLSENSFLTQAAKSHSLYMQQNKVVSHYEDKNGIGFTGVTPADRAIYHNYKSRKIKENISYNQKDIYESIDKLFAAIYHRFGFLSNDIDEIGIAKKDKYFTYDMGNSYFNKLCKGSSFNGYGKYIYSICKDKKFKIKYDKYLKIKNILKQNNPDIVIWPPKDSKGILPVFFNETPDPLPAYKVSGYPISVEFNDFYYKKPPTLIKFRIFEKDKQLDSKIITYKNDVNHLLTKYQFVLFPTKRLKWDTKYKVEFYYRDAKDGNIYLIKWDFKTKKLPYKVYTITKNKVIKVNPNKKYGFYFVPINQNDVIKIVSFRTSRGLDLKYRYIDQNTIELELLGSFNKGIIINLSNGRSLKVVLGVEETK